MMSQSNKPQSDKGSDIALVRLLARFMMPYWWRMVLVLILLLTVTGLSLLPPYIIQRAVDGPITGGNLSGLVPYGIVYFLIVLPTFCLRFVHLFFLKPF